MAAIKYLIFGAAGLLIFGGLYLKLLYDVPDAQLSLNRLTSWLLVVMGIAGVMAGLLWRSRNPLEELDTGNSR